MKTTIQERVSKNGNTYYCILLEIVPGVEKMVLLDNAEVALLKLSKVEIIKK